MTQRHRRSEEGTSAAPRGGTPVEAQWIEDWLVARIAGLVRVRPELIDVDESFVANGLTSSSGVALVGDLAKELNLSLSETLTWEYPTIAALAEYVAGLGASPHDE
ncbi:acyl carrier protein [Streptomyces sp. NPDC045251]|uniref:acyl carrier protein n=1 Tax=unclassified Streptomyces TaxID=2593676 RepID=UPI0033D4B4DB